MAQAKKKNQAQTGKSTARKTPAKSNAKKGTASRNTKNTKEERLEPALKKELVILAGLAAEGTTYVEDIHFIERGYETLVEKLTALGADISRIEDGK